jgi:hypothetical protein
MSVDQFLLSADTTDLNYPEIRPTLDLNFARVKALDPRITFTRSSGGSYVGADGLIKYAGVNEARFDHDPVTGESLGLLIEEARTNSIPNSTAQGAIFGSPGTVPTGWFSTGEINGLKREIVSTGTEDGIPYVDIRYSGTTTASSAFNILPSFTTAIPAASGQTWTGSAYVKLQAGSTANFSVITASVNGRTSSNLSSEVTNLIYTPTTAPLREQRRSVTHTMGNVSTERVTTTVFSGSFPSGVFIDITLRVGLPQLERGAFATSVIPTQASTRTRAADNASITGKNFSEWYRQDEGTIFSRSDMPKAVTTNNIGTVYYLTETNVNDIIGLRGANIGTIVQFLVLNSSRSSNTFIYQISNTDRFKGSLAYETDNTIASFNGILSPIGSSVSIPNPTSLQIGKISSNQRYMNGTISRLTYFPKRLPNAQLQALTR